MTKRFYVYEHRSLDGRVFYVGRGSTQNRRGKRGPYQRAYDFGQRDEAWRKAAQGGVEVVIVAEFDDDDSAAAREAELVARYGRASEGGCLTNHCRGGRGAPGQVNSEATRAKKAATKIGVQNPMHGRTGYLHHGRREVVDCTTGQKYPTVTAAAKALGMRMQTLHNMLTGFRPNGTSMRFA